MTAALLVVIHVPKHAWHVRAHAEVLFVMYKPKQCAMVRIGARVRAIVMARVGGRVKVKVMVMEMVMVMVMGKSNGKGKIESEGKGKGHGKDEVKV